MYIMDNSMEEGEANQPVDSIHVDSMVWSEPETGFRQERESMQLKSAAVRIKQAAGMGHIKPDYGSLGEFMKDVGISKDILMHNRKKKQDQQEDLEQKKMRTQLRGRNLDKVLTQNQASTLEKTTASKLVVERLFEDKFGMSVGEFCARGPKTDQPRPSYSTVAGLSNMLDAVIEQSKEKASMQAMEVKQDIPVLTRTRNQISDLEVDVISAEQRTQTILALQKQYPSLRKQALPEPKEAPRRDLLRSTVRLSQTSSLEVELAGETVTFGRVVGLLREVELESVTAIRVRDVAIADDLFCFLLDFFAAYDLALLRELAVENVRFGSNEKVCLKMREFVEATRVKTLCLHNIALRSREFCIVCLGVGSRACFDLCSFCDNQICELGLKCLEVLMKFRKETRFDFSGNPIARVLRSNVGYSRCGARQ